VRLPPWSYSMLRDEGNCPHLAYRRFIKKDLPKPKSKALQHGIDVHEALEKRIRDNEPLATEHAKYEPWAMCFDKRVCAVEMKLGVTREGRPCDFFAEDVFGRGKVDVVYSPAAKRLHVYDWKTGNVREDPHELEIQALLLQARFPDVTDLRGWYVWLKEDRLGEEHDLSNTPRTWRNVLETVFTMESRTSDTDWVKKPGPLCAWCEVKDCEHNRNKNA